MKVIIIGGGPAGMIAGIEASKKADVILLEKNEKLGKKLYITGKGRCNITNNCDEEEFILNVKRNPYFMYSSIYGFNSQRLMDYFNNLGVKLKTERGNRVFPVSDKSSDINRALEKELLKQNVKIYYNHNVKDILVENKKVIGVELDNNKKILGDKVILATGGLSYPLTGSTGDGYKFAKQLGHSIEKCYPILVPLKTKEKWIPELQGLSLKNIELSFYDNNKNVFNEFGEMLFTHEGISGPLVLTGSSALDGRKNIKASIDLKPRLDEKQLDKRILRDFEENLNRDLKNSLDKLLPKRLIPIIIKLSKIDPEKKINIITKEERQRLVDNMKKLSFTIIDSGGFNQAVVTRGGINVDEIDPATMESKIIKDLYFAGEIIDVDALTGGFNLQIAFSTGYLSGNSI